MKTESQDKVTQEFTTNDEFIKYVQMLWDENETDNNHANLERPEHIHEAMVYFISYTDFEIISI